MPRTVTLVLVDHGGTVLGALAPYEVRQPWWHSTDDIVEGARHRFGLDVTVLRLLGADRETQPGGAVTYLAQVSDDVAGWLRPGADVSGPPRPRADVNGRVRPVDDANRVIHPVGGRYRDAALSDNPNRADYARPGGPQATLAWATAALAERGRGPVTAAVQSRTWNLSSIWRLDTRHGPVWIKEVPSFLGHEPAVLRWLAAHGHGATAPSLIASDGRRMLLEHVPGEDLYGADGATRQAIAADVHAIQSTADIAELLALGVPDRRSLAPRLVQVAQAADVTDPRLDRLIEGLDARLDRVAECGLPDTLVHGDLHPGNALSTGQGRVILDWGDSVIGNPTFDILRLTDVLPDGERDAVRLAWAGWWRDQVPGCDPLAAVELLRPVEALYYAAIYAEFLANIEPSEHPYHALDVPEQLTRAAELAE